MLIFVHCIYPFTSCVHFITIPIESQNKASDFQQEFKWMVKIKMKIKRLKIELCKISRAFVVINCPCSLFLVLLETEILLWHYNSVQSCKVKCISKLLWINRINFSKQVNRVFIDLQMTYCHTAFLRIKFKIAVKRYMPFWVFKNADLERFSWTSVW